MRASHETMAPDEVGRVTYDDAAREAASREAASGDDPAPAFEALLYPNRSLPSAGFAAVMGVVIAVNVTLGVYFMAQGAWPVLVFGGLDVFLVWLAFKVSYRQGRLHERVRLTRNALSISRVLPSGHESRWRLQPFWTRIDLVDPGEHDAQVRVLSKGRTLLLGSFLSPEERVDFGRALKTAVDAARAPSA